MGPFWGGPRPGYIDPKVEWLVDVIELNFVFCGQRKKKVYAGWVMVCIFVHEVKSIKIMMSL